MIPVELSYYHTEIGRQSGVLLSKLLMSGIDHATTQTMPLPVDKSGGDNENTNSYWVMLKHKQVRGGIAHVFVCCENKQNSKNNNKKHLRLNYG